MSLSQYKLTIGSAIPKSAELLGKPGGNSALPGFSIQVIQREIINPESKRRNRTTAH